MFGALPGARAAVWFALGLALLAGASGPEAVAQTSRTRQARDLASPDLKQQLDLRVSPPEALTPPPFQPGQEVKYRVEFTNEGPYDSPETLVRIVLPEGLLGAAWSCQPVPALGSLRLKQSFSNNAEIASGLYGAAGLAFDPKNGTLWVASAFDATLMQFGKDASGKSWRALRVIRGQDSVISSMNGASGIWIAPEGGDLYLTGSLDNAVTQFRLEREIGAETSGTMTPKLVHVLKQGIEGVDGLVGATNLIGDPRGEYLYVAAPVSQAITTFRREPQQGRLSYVGTFGKTEAGRQCLAGVNSLALSSDGRFLYAAAYLDNTVVVCERTPADGKLKLRQVVSRTDSDALPLEEPYALALSPDGRHLYVTAFASDALLVFRRDAGDGHLEHLQTIRNGTEGVSSLDGPCAIAISPDGMDVVVACQFSSTVMEFRRDALTGKVQPLGEQKEGQASVTGLSGASGLAFSPDGETLAAAAGESSALHLFQKVKYMPQLSGGGDVRARVDLSSGGKLVYTIYGQAAPLGDTEMELRARIDGGATMEDTEPGNNFAKRSDRVERPKPDLQLAVQDPPASVPAGGNFDLNLLVTNHGRQDALGLRLDLPLPPGVLGLGWHAESTPPVTELRADARLLPPARPDPNAKVDETPRESIAIDPGEKARKAAEKARKEAQIDPALTWLDAKLVVASPDGRHVYALCGNPARFVIFQRDLGSGAIGPVSVFPQQGEELAERLLEDISRLVFTPEGEGLFALNPKTGAVALFRRDPLTGTLNLANLWWKSDPRLEGLLNATDLAITPNGRHVLIYQAQGQRLLRISLLPSRPGMVLWQAAPPISLAFPGLTADPGVAAPSGVKSPVMAVARGGKLIYLSNAALGGITAFHLPDLDNPAAEPVAQALPPVAGPKQTANLLLSPDERQLYAYERASGLFYTLTCDSATGALRPGLGEPTSLKASATAPGESDLPFAFMADGRTLLLPREVEPGSFGLVAALRDPATGYLAIPDKPATAIPPDQGDDAFAAITVSTDLKDAYTLRREDFAIQHLRDLRPAAEPDGLGRLATRLALPAGSSILYRAQLRLSPTFQGDRTALNPAISYDRPPVDGMAEPAQATATAEINVAHPSQAKLQLRLLEAPLEPGLPGRFEVSVRNELATPLVESQLDTALKGRLEDVRWRALALPSAGQWRDLASRSLREADGEGKTVDIAVSPDEKRLFVLEDAPARLRVFKIAPETYELAEEPSTALEDSTIGVTSQFTQLAVGLSGKFVYILDEAGLVIQVYVLAPDGRYVLANKQFLPVDLEKEAGDQLPGPLRMDWDEKAQALALWRETTTGATVNARYTVNGADGGLNNLRVAANEVFSPPGGVNNASLEAATGDGLMRFTVSDDGQTLLTQRNSVSQYAAEGTGILETPLELDGQSDVTFQIEGKVMPDALGFIALDAQLQQGKNGGEWLRKLDEASERWRLAPVADLKATLVAQGPSKLGESTPFLLTLRNEGPSRANAVWLRNATMDGWKESARPDDVTLPQRVEKLDVGEEATFKLAFTPAEYVRPAGSDPASALPLPAIQAAHVLISPATDGPKPGENMADFVYPRPRMNWDHYGPATIARRERVFLDAYLDLPADAIAPVVVHLQGPADWTWESARPVTSRPGGDFSDSPWLAELRPADQGLFPGQASVFLTPAMVETKRADASVRLILTGRLTGIGPFPNGQAEPPIRLNAALEYTDTLYGPATSRATPDSIGLEVGRPNPSILITQRLAPPGNHPEEVARETSIPLIVRNLAANGAAPLVDFVVRPETPSGWRWIGAETEDPRLVTPTPEDADDPLTVRISHLPVGESAVVWLRAQRTETGGAPAAVKK